MTHELRDDTLQAVPGGIAAICTCGWTSGPRFTGLVASAMFQDHRLLHADDPTMEEIVASIRRILAEDSEVPEQVSFTLWMPRVFADRLAELAKTQGVSLNVWVLMQFDKILEREK